MMSLHHYLIFSSLLFCIGVCGLLLNQRSLLNLLMSLEIILLAINTNFVAIAQHLEQRSGQIMVFFILTVAAAESAIGLSLLTVIFRQKQSIAVDTLSELKG